MTLSASEQQMVTKLRHLDRDSAEFKLTVHGYQRSGERKLRMEWVQSQELSVRRDNDTLL